jgi:hypothetical protein
LITNKYARCLLIFCGFALAATANATPDVTSTFSEWVDDEGNISLPIEFRRTWTFLGTWSVAKDDVEPSAEASNHGAAGLHNVYTQPAAIEAYRKTGEFPDGTVIIKELLTASTGSMTTGTVSWGQKVEGWFIMVKDRHNRFPDHPLWGEGWGWVLVNADAPATAVTTNYKTECLGCHIPARRADWIYIEGYPVLNSK